jgi:hypothetical protein
MMDTSSFLKKLDDQLKRVNLNLKISTIPLLVSVDIVSAVNEPPFHVTYLFSPEPSLAFLTLSHFINF